jgi:hypothetical protein
MSIGGTEQFQRHQTPAQGNIAHRTFAVTTSLPLPEHNPRGISNSTALESPLPFQD